jgi:hypothetical protein
MAAKEKSDDDGKPIIVSVRRVDDYNIEDCWEIEVAGCGTVRMPTKDLYANRRFNQTCMEDLNHCFAPVRSAEWNRKLDAAMREAKT